MGGDTVEIITGRERRRRWRLEEKLRIVAETEEPGARVTEVAARHGVYPGLLFTWRRQVRDGMLVAAPATFVPIRMLEEPEPATGSTGDTIEGEQAVPAKQTPHRSDLIDITLSNGCRLLIDQHVDARALRRIVGVLRG